MSAEPVRFACPRCGKHYRAPRQQVEEGAGRLGVRCSQCGQSMRVRWTGSAAEVEPLPDGAAPPDLGEAPRGTNRDGPGKGLEAGTRLGRYELQGVVGRGGMATVYKAFDPAANRSVALKLLPQGAAPEEAERFQREVEVQGNVHHPNLMPVFDSGAAGDQRYYTMELVRDPFQLSQLILLSRSGEAARTPRLKSLATPEGLIRHVLLPVCEAIYHANVREGVLHRDLSPGNVLVDAMGLRPYVIDFGVCALLERKNPRLAHLQAPAARVEAGVRRVTGTLLYMPPEQLQGVADRRGDVWALGALLHAIVTGEPPLAPAVKSSVPTSDRIEGLRLLVEQAEREGDLGEAEGYRAKLNDLLAGRERTPADLHRDILEGRYQPRPPLLDGGLDAIIRKAMDPAPRRRYRNARALREDLEAWLSGSAVEALVERHSGLGRLAYRGRLLLRRHRGWILVGTALAVGALGVTLWTSRAPGPDLGKRKEEARERFALVADGADGAGALAQAELARWIALDPADPAPWEAFRAADERRQARREASERERLLADLLEAERSAVPQGVRSAAEALDAWALQRGDVRLRLRARGARTLEVHGPGASALTAVRPVDARGHVGAAQPAGGALDPGRWIAVLGPAPGGGSVWVPFEVPRGPDPVRVGPVPDVGALPVRTLLVPAGRVRGPLGEVQVGALLWEQVEVTIERYAAWIATLTLEEQERRVPRMAGPLGESPRPLWIAGPSGWSPARGTNTLHPVDGISLYDARAFAAAQGQRLPSAAEWAWAASGPFAAATPVGQPDQVFVLAGLVLGGASRHPAAVGTVESDVSPFGLLDMAGNVAEFTETLATVEGTNGWLVMGSGYALPAERALLARAAPMPGWMPLQGVGMRLVQPVP